MQPKLGIIAGGGVLPQRVIDICQGSGRAYYVIAIKQHTVASVVDGSPHSWFNLSRVGRVIKTLKNENVREVLMIGDIRPPSLRCTWPDLWTFKMLVKFSFWSLVKPVGDNIKLTVLARELEKNGFNVVGVHEIISGLLAPEGHLSSVPVDKSLFTDIEYGIPIALNIGRRDLGQAVIIKSNKVIAKEGRQGTAQMIRDSFPSGVGGVLIKLKKPQQDRRFDLPTIGVDTILQASDAGLAGIVIQAGETIVVDIEAVISLADEKGIFVKSVNLNRGI